MSDYSKQIPEISKDPLPLELSNYVNLMAFFDWSVELQYDRSRELYLVSADRGSDAGPIRLWLQYALEGRIEHARLSNGGPQQTLTDIKNRLIEVIMMPVIDLWELLKQ